MRTTGGNGVRAGGWAPAAALALAAATAGAASGQSGESLELTLENIHTADGGVSSVEVAPDGGRTAIVMDGEQGRGVYRLSLDDAPRPSVAAVESRGSEAEGRAAPEFWVRGGSPTWAPSGDAIVFVRGGALWRADVGAGEPRRLTESMEGLRDPVFGPQGRRVAFYATESGHQDIWVVDARGSGEPRQLTEEAMPADDPRFEPSWSPDGTSIAYVSNAADYWEDDVYRVDVETGDVQRLTWALMASSTPRWSPSGDRIALMGTAKSGYWYQDLSDIWVLDPGSPRSERRLEMQVWASDRAMRNDLIWSDGGDRLFFPYMERGDYDLWSVSSGGGVATRVTNLGGSMRSFEAPASADAVYFVREGPAHGDELYRVAAAGGPAERLTSVSPRWRGTQVPREVSYRSFDGLYIQGFLYTPPETGEGKRCPAVVQVHGGGTNSYLRDQNLTEQYLASQGFVVLAINYRGGSGFGRSFQDLAVEDWLHRQARDPGAAADWLRDLTITTDRVGIYGGSYGGMQSMAAITRTPEKFDAAVPMRGTYAGAQTFWDQDRLGKIFAKTGHGGLPEERPEVYERTTQTVERFDRIQAPVLVMHGEEDVRAPFSNYEIAVEKLRELGKDFEEKSYPGQGHGFSDPDARIDMYTRLQDFMRDHLGGCE